jgi:hypothetical protein
MSNKKTPMINILTFGLPFKLANQIYNEYQSRLSESKYIIDVSDRYKPLTEYIETVKILLALTIFHKRVISNLDAAVKFYEKVKGYSEVDTIQIGSYNFTGDEKNKILGLTINYNKLKEKFRIPKNFADYELTKDFLVKVLSMLSDFNYGTDNKEEGDIKTEENDLPF